ncbi:MAG: NAD-dependent epimerase/dehydratase family protein, partial [Acidimicrobiia bacterium]|nr:NAD-dependent epimerase/dehydratase family protein [Acidimicrobiia bacterium]
MKVLVTGGGGFLGGAVVRALVDRGDDVRSFSRQSYPGLVDLGVETARGDLADPDAVSAAVQGVDGVIHVGAKADMWGDPAEFAATNIEGTRHVIDACLRHGVTRLVFTSTPSVVHGGGHVSGVDESEPYAEEYSSPYPESKAAAERLVLAAASDTLGTVALRPHLIWGPGDTQLILRIIERARKGRARLVGSGDNLVDTTYVDNAVVAHLAALDRLTPGATISGKSYFIAQDDPRPVRDIINAIVGAAGAPPVERTVPLAVARGAGLVLEWAYRWLPLSGEPYITRFLA